MKIDTLSFIQCLLTGHHPTVFHPHAQVLVPAIIAAVSDSFYKISSEALVVLQLLVKVLRPLDSSPTTFDFTLYTNNIYQCCFVRLKVSVSFHIVYVFKVSEIKSVVHTCCTCLYTYVFCLSHTWTL